MLRVNFSWLLVPKVVLSPIWLVTEYGLRKPLWHLASAVENRRLIAKTIDFFTWNEGRTGFFPIFHIEKGLSNTVGFYAFADAPIFSGHDIRVKADTDFENSNMFVFLNRFQLANEDVKLAARFSFEERNDFVYFGTGAGTQQSDETRRYEWKRAAALCDRRSACSQRHFGMES